MTRMRLSRLLLSNHCQRKYTCRSSTIATITTLGEEDATIRDMPVKPFSEIPGPRGLYEIPYLGMALHFKPFTQYGHLDTTEVFKSLRDRYGDIVRLKIESKDTVLISHPQYAEEIFRLPYKEHQRVVVAIQEAFYMRNNIKVPALSVLNGEKWTKMRKPAQEKLLKPSTVATYVPITDSVSSELTEKLGKTSNVTDMLYELTNYTAENVVRITFNKKIGWINGKKDIDFYTIMCNIFRIFHESFFMPIQPYRYLRTKMYNEFERDLLEVYDFVLKLLNEQIDYLQTLERDNKLDEHLENEPNFLRTLLSDPRITPDQVESIIIDMFTGGITSTANGILFTLCDLALHPDKQANLYEEINRIVGDSDHMTTDHFQQMSYLKSCLKESQRMIYPVFLGAIRFMESDVNIGGYTIPEGTQVMINNELMCKDERFFPRVDEYIPERWMRGKENEIYQKSKAYPFILKPFGFGARSCLGQRIAELSMYASIAKIIQKYEVSLPSDVTEIKWKRQVFATPVDKIEMFFKDRKP